MYLDLPKASIISLVHFKNVLNVPLAWQVAFDRPVSDFVPDESMSPSRISVADLT